MCASSVLGEGTSLGIPAAFHDLVADAIALGCPAVHASWAGPMACHPDGAVERHPGLQPAVGEVLLPAAGLPDALVRLVPVVAQPVDHAGDVLPAAVGGLLPLDIGLVYGIAGLGVERRLVPVDGTIGLPEPGNS